MKPEQIKEQVKQLALPDQIQLVADIWDNIAAEHSDLPMPEWQKQELDRRFNEYSAGKSQLHECAQVHEELRAKYR